MADKEYIEREALIAEYDRVHEGEAGKARKLMVDAPAADVVEVRHGEWIFEFAFSGHSLYRCSVCGRQESLLTKESTAEYFPYCHCGAKMDGKGENDG